MRNVCFLLLAAWLSPGPPTFHILYIIFGVGHEFTHVIMMSAMMWLLKGYCGLSFGDRIPQPQPIKTLIYKIYDTLDRHTFIYIYIYIYIYLCIYNIFI